MRRVYFRGGERGKKRKKRKKGKTNTSSNLSYRPTIMPASAPGIGILATPSFTVFDLKGTAPPPTKSVPSAAAPSSSKKSAKASKPVAKAGKPASKPASEPPQAITPELKKAYDEVRAEHGKQSIVKVGGKDEGELTTNSTLNLPVLNLYGSNDASLVADTQRRRGMPGGLSRFITLLKGCVLRWSHAQH